MCRMTMSLWHVREHEITQSSLELECRMQLEPFQYYLARLRLRSAGHISGMPFLRWQHIFFSSWVDYKQHKQRPQFNYENSRIDVKVLDMLAGDSNLWHAITKHKNIHCHASCGCYAWPGPGLRLFVHDRDPALPAPSSFAGVLLGLLLTSLSKPIAISPSKLIATSPAESTLSSGSCPFSVRLFRPTP